MTPSTITAGTAPVQPFVIPEGFAVDPKQLDLHARALAVMRARPGLDMVGAMRLVQPQVTAPPGYYAEPERIDLDRRARELMCADPGLDYVAAVARAERAPKPQPRQATAQPAAVPAINWRRPPASVMPPVVAPSPRKPAVGAPAAPAAVAAKAAAELQTFVSTLARSFDDWPDAATHATWVRGRLKDNLDAFKAAGHPMTPGLRAAVQRLESRCAEALK